MTRNHQTLAFFVAAVASVLIKMSLASLAHNYDVDSYVLVADTMREGRVVYADPAAQERYNYAPAWAFIVTGLRSLQEWLYPDEPDDGVRMFHVLVVLLLSYVDILMALWLMKRHSLAASLVFLLNPVSWLLTGLHSQFDMMALYVGFVGADLALGRSGDRPPATWSFVMGVVLLGLSLITKHILAFLPLWFLVRADITWPRKLALLMIPSGMFVATFLPFVANPEALQGIRDHVLGYEAYQLTGFLPHVIDAIYPVETVDRLLSALPVVGGFKLIWLAALCGTGVLLRRLPMEHVVLYHVTALVVFSGQLADQYLAIPLAACAVFYRSPWVWGYGGFTLFYLFGSDGNIGTVEGFEWLAAGPHAIGIEAWWALVFLFVFLVTVRCRRKPMSV